MPHHAGEGLGLPVVLGENKAFVVVCALWAHRFKDQAGHSRRY